jgi:hypothetical protein
MALAVAVIKTNVNSLGICPDNFERVSAAYDLLKDVRHDLPIAVTKRLIADYSRAGTWAGKAAQGQSTSNVPAFFAPSLCCRTGRVWRDVIGRRRAENNQVDIFGLAPCTLERLFGGSNGEVGCHPVLRGIKALVDTRAARELVDDVRPSQRGETRRQFRVGHDLLGQTARGGDNLCDACTFPTFLQDRSQVMTAITVHNPNDAQGAIWPRHLRGV